MEQNRGLDPREAGQAVPRALVQPSGSVPDEDRVDHPRGRSAVQRTGENCAVFGFEVRAVSIIGGVCFRYRSTGNFCLWCVLLLSKYRLFLFVVYMYDTHVLWFSKYEWVIYHGGISKMCFCFFEVRVVSVGDVLGRLFRFPDHGRFLLGW